MPGQLRRFRPGDEAALFQVYLSAIRGIAARDYTAEQIDAWAPADLDPDLWANKMRALQPFVVEIDGRPVAYADVQPNGYIDHFFVSAEVGRQGVGTQLMTRIHEEAALLGLTELTSDVSKTAEPFYARHGFTVVERAFPVRRGVMLQNAKMRKQLPTSTPASTIHKSG